MALRVTLLHCLQQHRPDCLAAHIPVCGCVHAGGDPVKLLHSGKVRDIYSDRGDIILVASDRLSVFDVILPTPTLDASAQVLRTSGSLLPVTITDVRVPDAPWSFTGQVDDFSNGTQSFTGAGLGWSPSITTHNLVGTTPIAGATVAGAEGAGATFPTTGGLKTARAFAYTSAAGTGTSAAPTGSGLGTTVVGGGLTLNVPTNTVPGVYVAHLTLTAI